MYFIIKCLVSGVVVGVISEISRRSTPLGAVIASLPLTSILAFIWIYHENHNLSELGKLSIEIALIVLPSIMFFVLFWFFIRAGWSFYPTLATSILGLSFSYLAYGWMLAKVGIKIN